MKNSKLFIPAVIGGLFVFTLATPAMATGTETEAPQCQPLSGWYVNPDETEDSPEQVPLGLLFEGKDLIHHATSPLALADVHGGSFKAVGDDGKVVFKMETANPYSTIIQNVDGKFWSSRLAVNAPGGQNSPVDSVTEMIGSDTKTGNPKYTNDTHVVTFGVGYWVEEGSTTVTSITFHGTTYKLACVPPTATPTPSATVSATPTPTKSATATPTPSRTTGAPAATVSTTPVAGNVGGLPVTGSRASLLFLGGAAAVLIGAAGILVARRRRDGISFEA